MSDLSAKMSRRVQAAPTKRAAEVFRAPTRDMQRVTVYLPKDTVRALKQAALDDGTSVSRILTERAEKWLKGRRNDAQTS